MGGIWGHIGTHWGDLGTLGTLRGHIGTDWGDLGTLGGHLGTRWGHLGTLTPSEMKVLKRGSIWYSPGSVAMLCRASWGGKGTSGDIWGRHRGAPHGMVGGGMGRCEVGMATWGQWGPQLENSGDSGDPNWRTWGQWGPQGEDMGTMGTPRGGHGDNGDLKGRMWGQWGQWGPHVEDMGTTRTSRGGHGDPN